MKKLKGGGGGAVKSGRCMSACPGRCERPRSMSSDVPKMRAWQEQQRGSAPGVPVKGSFAEDVAAHLAQPVVAAMPSIDQRRAHLLLAIEALGADRTSASITSDDIESMIQAWLKVGLAPATVYHRLPSSLSSFFLMLRWRERQRL